MLRDVTGETPVKRMSVARGRIHFQGGRPHLSADVLGATQAAGVQAAKDASRTLPTVHAVAATDAFCGLAEELDGWTATVTLQAHARTSLESSAACGVAAALLTLWEAGKDRQPRIESVELVQNVA